MPPAARVALAPSVRSIRDHTLSRWSEVATQEPGTITKPLLGDYRCLGYDSSKIKREYQAIIVDEAHLRTSTLHFLIRRGSNSEGRDGSRYERTLEQERRKALVSRRDSGCGRART